MSNSENYTPEVESPLIKSLFSKGLRNKLIVEAYKDGYSQHMIAKVLELNQATVQRIIKRNSSISIT
jgi:predicted transcriptional regulator